MDPSNLERNAEPDERISALLGEFFDRREAGEEITAERFAVEHPGAADELRQHLAGLALIDSALPQLRGDSAPEDHRRSEGVGVSAEALRPARFLGYELIEEIGRGGMGVVYKALQVSTKRIVALKVMLAGPYASSTARRRFDREIELAARLKHPGIVRVLESGEVAGQRYYAMDYVAGVRFDHHTSRSRADRATTLRLFVQICEAVDYAHGIGVIHRDLKPGNVLIDQEEHPYILDFGLAKATDQADTEEALTTCVSLPGQVVGTLFYLSPEQAAGEPDQIDARTDVHALGVMLYEALTGSLPFDTTGRPSDVIERIQKAAPVRPALLSDRVDAELETILLKTLEKEKARRYQSAAELAEDLRLYLAGEPILARRPSSLYVLRKKLRKHRLATVLGAAAVALVLVGLLAESWWRQRESNLARRAAAFYQFGLEGQSDHVELGPSQVLFSRHPEVPEVVLVLGQALCRSGQLHGAIKLLDPERDDHPCRWACDALLAEVYRELGDTEQADALQARAEQRAPDTAEAQYLSSFTTLDLQYALRCVREALRRDPSHILARRRLTHLRLRTDDLDGALRGADELIELGEDRSEWTNFKACILAKQGRFREAIEYFTQLDAYIYRAHVYRRIKEYEKAADDYTMALERSGEPTGGAWARYQRATPLWILGRPEEALADYERVRTLLGYPWYSDARRFLILRELGRRREAQEVLDAALRDVDRPSWLRQVLRCLDGQMSAHDLVTNEAAQNNLERLCEAYYYAGEFCLLEGRPVEARAYFEQCVQTGLEFDPDTELTTPMNEYELAQWRLESPPAAETGDSQSQTP